jgi:hypothetical protein
MTADTATFIIDQVGRIEVMLGTHLVGVIEPEREGTAAIYRVLLPVNGAVEKYRRAPSVQMARYLVLAKMIEWFSNAGPVFEVAAGDLMLQAHEEKQAAEAPSLLAR